MSHRPNTNVISLNVLAFMDHIYVTPYNDNPPVHVDSNILRV